MSGHAMARDTAARAGTKTARVSGNTGGRVCGERRGGAVGDDDLETVGAVAGATQVNRDQRGKQAAGQPTGAERN